MSDFPRTEVGRLSVSRMIIGSNWFLGYSHTSRAKDAYIRENVKDRGKIADVLEAFLKRGVDAIMAPLPAPPLMEAVREAEDRTGRGVTVISTPGLPVSPETAAKGFDLDAVARILDDQAAMGVHILLPHESTTDLMVDRCTREVRHMGPVCRLIRERGMVPGLSVHQPQAIIYADETGLDVETYIAIYNAMGFMMPIEVDWVASIIREARKPVMTIKPMASGQLRPFQALTFVWNTLRDCDMVTVGTMSAAEAEECVELSLSALERRGARVELQETRSKASVKRKR
jgi:hypothetical protein